MRLVDCHVADPPDLFVVDPLATFIPGDEGSSLAMASFLDPLRGLARAGSAVLVMHHPRKGDVRSGQAARGSGALPGAADILVEMECFGRFDETDRRRRLVGFSRFEETPRGLEIELYADGLEYRVLPSLADRDFDGG